MERRWKILWETKQLACTYGNINYRLKFNENLIFTDESKIMMPMVCCGFSSWNKDLHSKNESWQ